MRSVVVLVVALAAFLAIASELPPPHGATAVRIAVYASQTVWFALELTLVAVLVRGWAAPLARLLGTLALLAVIVVVLNLFDVKIASDVAKVLFAATAGAAFVRTIERPWWLLPIAVCVPIADAWSVFSSRGVTHAVVDRAREDPAWIRWPTIASPFPSLPYESFPRIGIVDVLFAALFLGVATRWQLGVRRGVIALTVGFMGTVVLVLEGVDVAIPALPLLCLAFLVAYGPALVRDARGAASGTPPPTAAPDEPSANVARHDAP